MVTKESLINKIKLLSLLIEFFLSMKIVACNEPVLNCVPCTINSNTLMRIDQAHFGGPVRSVAWLSDNSLRGPHKNQFVAVGGYACQCNDLCIYKISNKETFEKVVKVNLGSFILSLAWCVINHVPYLAVAGSSFETGDNIQIYRFDIWPKPKLTLVDSYKNHADVYAVSWLCAPCQNNTCKRYLAIGGNPSRRDQADIRVLLFDAESDDDALTETSHKVHGAPVYSLDWVVQDNGCPLLAVGGRSSRLECNDINVRIFSFDCTHGYLSPVTYQVHNAPVVNAVKWLSQPGKGLYLAAGGARSTEDNVNIRMYMFNSSNNTLIDLADVANNPLQQIFSVDWYTYGADKYITAGGGCESKGAECVPNIFIYKDVIVNGSHVLQPVTEEKFDENITSLNWNKTDGFGCAYLIAGTERDRAACGANECPDSSKDVVLYKAKLGSNGPVPTPCEPVPEPGPRPCSPCNPSCEPCCPPVDSEFGDDSWNVPCSSSDFIRVSSRTFKGKTQAKKDPYNELGYASGKKRSKFSKQYQEDKPAGDLLIDPNLLV
jgi:hypothetical protein